MKWVLECLYYSVGGGFIQEALELTRNISPSGADEGQPFPFTSGADLLALAEAAHLTIADIMMANELASTSRAEVERQLDKWARSKPSTLLVSRYLGMVSTL